MSEILSKSMHMPGAGTSLSAVAKTETNGDELLFAALFGGAKGDMSANDDNGDVAILSGVFTVQTTEQENPENPLPDELLVMISALQAVKGFDQKQVGKVNDAALENSEKACAGENSDALADIIAAVPPGAHIDLASGDLAKGAIADSLKNTNSTRANMTFDNGKLSGQATANLRKLGLGPMQGPMAQQMLIMSPNVSIKPFGEVQAAPSETFIGPMPALSADTKMASIITNLRAIRAANLEQRNAEINAKLSGDDAVDFIKKSDRAIITASNLKQTVMSDSPLAMGDKVLARATTGLDMARPSHASAGAVDSTSGASGQSSNNQTGGQTGGQAGGQSGGQAGAASGGGLLNNLNMLQTLDMAKNNWTEMLLQRVQKGLAGGKDRLDFQLNPRNLGKMQISLMIQNDRTNIQIQTETSAAASILSDSEARLAQMLEASGLRLGNLHSGQSQGFGGNMSGGHANQQNQAKTSGKTIAGTADSNDGNSADAITEHSENLINIQA